MFGDEGDELLGGQRGEGTVEMKDQHSVRPGCGEQALALVEQLAVQADTDPGDAT